MRRFPLLWYFLATSFVVIAVVTVALTIILNGRAQGNFIARSESQGATEVFHTLQMYYYNILAPRLEDDPDVAIEDAVNPQMMGIFAGRTTFGLNTNSISVFDLQGRLVYSTDPQAASIPENERDRFRQVVEGTASANLATGKEITGLNGETRKLDTVQSFVAITDVAPDSGREGAVLGVLSISQDVTEAHSAARSDAFWSAVVTSVTAGGALFLILFFFVFRADRHIAKGHGQLRSQQESLKREIGERERAEAALETVNRSLEDKVRQRTGELTLANDELRQRNGELIDARAQAATDALTGLLNHGTFQDRIRSEVSRAQENEDTVGLVMLDIDDFKQLNDSQGHLAGDAVLQQVAVTLGEVVKPSNAYRYGGDEFAVLLPGVDGRKTAALAERLRRSVQRRDYNSGSKVTVSLGLACFPEGARSGEELIYGADASMYWAKSQGKNRVGDWGNLVKHRKDGTLPWYGADRAVKAPDVVFALVAALSAKDPITSAHTERCSWYTAKLAQEMGLAEDEASVVRLASLLHDIGKLGVPDEVLFKPGPLNDKEWAQMRKHPAAALHVLSQIRSINSVTPAVLHHHEHFDGSGYPDGLAGDDIPVASRILLVTDAFDAMTTDRPYRKAMPIEAAVEELRRNSGGQFDPTVVDAFLRVMSRPDFSPPHFMASGEEAQTVGGRT